MIRHLLSFMMLAVAAVWPAAATAQDLAGTWTGSMRQPDSELAVTMVFEVNYDGSWIGRIDVPVWGARLSRSRGIGIRGQRVSFQVETDSVTGSFDGSISPDGDTLSGNLAGDTGNYSVELTRIDAGSGDAASLEGAWEGLLDAGGFTTNAVLVVSRSGAGAVTATMRMGDPDSVARPIDAMVFHGDLVRFTIQDLRVFFIGLLEEDGNLISGTWRQGDAQLRLALEKRDNNE